MFHTPPHATELKDEKIVGVLHTMQSGLTRTLMADEQGQWYLYASLLRLCACRAFPYFPFPFSICLLRVSGYNSHRLVIDRCPSVRLHLLRSRSSLHLADMLSVSSSVDRSLLPLYVRLMHVILMGQSKHTASILSMSPINVTNIPSPATFSIRLRGLNINLLFSTA